MSKAVDLFLKQLFGRKSKPFDTYIYARRTFFGGKKVFFIPSDSLCCSASAGAEVFLSGTVRIGGCRLCCCSGAFFSNLLSELASSRMFLQLSESQGGYSQNGWFL